MQGTVAGALPIIVTNYARAFGVVVRMQGMQAYTDGDVITIPRLDLKDPVKARLAYGYLAHEAAHVRYTDFSIVKKCSGNYLRSSILNILEDARVERLIGSSFIGVWENLELLRSYRSESWEQYKTKVGWLPLLQVILAFLLCYTGSYCQRFRILRDRAAFLCRILRARMSKHGVRRLARLSLRVLRCKNTAEIMRLGEDIISLLNTKGVFDPNNHKPIKMPRRKRKLSEAAGDTGALKRQRLNAELSRELYELQKSIAGDFSKLAPCSDPSSVLTDINEDSESARDDLGIFEVGVCRSGRPDFITKIESSARLRRQLSARIRSYVENLGGSRLQGHRINPYKAVMAEFGENEIFYDRIEEQGMSTSVHLLVDVSGSMISTDGEALTRAEAACRCALSLALALDGIDGVVSMCSFFPGIKCEIETALKPGQRVRECSSLFDQKPRGSTPLAQALWHAALSVELAHCNRNIVLVLTDGIPDSIKQAKIALEHLQALNVECYGIGLRLDFIRSLIPQSRVISSPSELEQAMFSLLERVLLGGDRAFRNDVVTEGKS